MEHVIKRFSENELDILRSVKGKTLNSIDALELLPSKYVWERVRLHFDDLHFDLIDELKPVPVDDEGYLEDFGLLSVNLANDDQLLIQSMQGETSTFDFNEKISEVAVVNNLVDIYKCGRHIVHLEYPQAVAFFCPSGVILIDKEIFFSEMFVISRGERIEDLLYDESESWKDEPDEDQDTHFEYKREIQYL